MAFMIVMFVVGLIFWSSYKEAMDDEHYDNEHFPPFGW